MVGSRASVRRARGGLLIDASFVLVVDAIPWELAVEVWQQGHLPGFSEPVPSVSVFPSSSNVALPALIDGILGARPPGYEARYYHPPSATIRGRPGAPEADRPMVRYRARPGPLDLVAGPIVARFRASREVARLMHRFVRESGSWLAYASATDGIGHFGGREALLSAFRTVTRHVVEARRVIEMKHGTAPPVILTSDHGMAFGRLAHVSGVLVSQALKNAGFVRQSAGSAGFFLPSMGEIAAGVCFVAPDGAATVARILTRVEGIDVVVARRGEESALIVRGNDEALLDWRGGRYRYHESPGDPLRYAPVWAELRGSGAIDGDGFVDGDALFAATWSHDYPDALHRIRRALTDLVEFPAPVLFSMRPGYTYGPPLTHAGSRLLGGQVGTHGALSSEQSLGFLSVAGVQAPPPVVRAESALIPYRDLVIRGASHSESHH